MLENWMWQPDILKRISRHVVTGRTLPDSLIQRIVTLKHLSDGFYWGRQAALAAYDMTIHTSPHRVDPTATYRDMVAQYGPFTMPTGTFPEASFTHIMGGYEAGVYSYLWAKVYAQDMFTRFERDGILDQRTGRAYRDQILAPSGTEEPDTLVRRFLGRPGRPSTTSWGCRRGRARPEAGIAGLGGGPTPTARAGPPAAATAPAPAR
jgi:thimet oligopeptidase